MDKIEFYEKMLNEANLIADFTDNGFSLFIPKRVILMAIKRYIESKENEN